MKIKNNLLRAALLAMAGFALSTQSAKALVDYTTGDVILGFQKAGSDSIVVNIGQFDLYRDATSTFTINTIGTGLGTLLTNTYGAGWTNDSSVYWGVAEAVTNGKPSGLGAVAAFNGDPASTFYVSIPQNPYGTQTTSGYTINNLTTQQQVAGGILGVENVFKNNVTASANLNNKGGLMPTSLQGDWAELNPTTVPTSSWAALPFTLGNFGNGTSGTQLDFYRQLSSTTGNTGEAGTALQGVYEGSFTITDGGFVTFNIAPVPVPEPATYGALAGVALSGVAFGNVLRRRKKLAA